MSEQERIEQAIAQAAERQRQEIADQLTEIRQREAVDAIGRDPFWGGDTQEEV